PIPIAPMIAVVVALTLIVAAQPVLAQSAMAPADSEAILRTARSEQEKFERIHRDELPVTQAGGFDHCDEEVKGHCFIYGDPEDEWKAPKESKRLSDARDSLLARLAKAATALPGNPWIAGQRVRYLVNAKQPNAARSAATECRPEESWWCLALTGFAAHAAQEYGPAEA